MQVLRPLFIKEDVFLRDFYLPNFFTMKVGLINFADENDNYKYNKNSMQGSSYARASKPRIPLSLITQGIC